MCVCVCVCVLGREVGGREGGVADEFGLIEIASVLIRILEVVFFVCCHFSFCRMAVGFALIMSLVSSFIYEYPAYRFVHRI